MTRYIVIVYPPVATSSDLAKVFYQVGSVQANMQPKVSRVTARSPEAAADTAKVPAGGYALIIDEATVRRFDRAPIAQLEERATDGNPLIRAEAAVDA